MLLAEWSSKFEATLQRCLACQLPGPLLAARPLAVNAPDYTQDKTSGPQGGHAYRGARSDEIPLLEAAAEWSVYH